MNQTVHQIGKVVRSANRSEIHRRTGIHLSHVSRILSGKRTASTDKLAAIAQAMGLSMVDLYLYLNHRKRKSRAA